jgi:hypothetical protein
MAHLQHVYDVAPRKASGFHQHRDMIEEVGDLLGTLLGRGTCAGERNFYAFLTDFLGDARRALFEQPASIAIFAAACRAVGNYRGEVREPAGSGQLRTRKAARRPKMASWTSGGRNDE